MSSGTDFGLFLAGSGKAASLELADAAGNVTPMSAAAAVHFVEQSASRLCVNDAYSLARSALFASSIHERPRTLASICRLASEYRLLCLTAAESVSRSAGRELHDAPPPDSSKELAHLAPKLLALLRKVASSIGMTGDEDNGPLGFHFRVRAAAACGAVSTSTLPLDQRVLPDVVANCRTIADARFRTVIGHPDAPHMFKGGKDAEPDAKGFRETRLGKVQEWLGSQLDCVTNSLDLPVREAMASDLASDVHLRNWPRWALGTPGLVAFADLQDVEHLTLQFERASTQRGPLSPKYDLSRRIASRSPDLAVYRRFREFNDLAPVFVPPAQRKWLRVFVPELPLLALAATLEREQGCSIIADEIRARKRPSSFCQRILVDAGLELNVEQVVAFVTTLACGASAKTIAEQVNRFDHHVCSGMPLERASNSLRAAWVGLDLHLADQTLKQLAAMHQIESQELDSLTGKLEPAPRAKSFFHRYVASGLSRAFIPGLEEARVLAGPLRNRFGGAVEPPDPKRLANTLRDFRGSLTERVVSPAGRVQAGLSWTEARSSFLLQAEEAILASAFALLKSGHCVIAMTGDELLIEVENSRTEFSASSIRSKIEPVFSALLGGLPVEPRVESVGRW